MNIGFNETFSDKADKPRFIHQRNPVNARAWQLFEFKPLKREYEPVGEYIVLDTAESAELSQKKIDNLVHLLNGKRDLEDLGRLTETRILFNVVPRVNDVEHTKIIFRTHDGKGVSKENAIFTIERGILND